MKQVTSSPEFVHRLDADESFCLGSFEKEPGQAALLAQSSMPARGSRNG